MQVCYRLSDPEDREDEAPYREEQPHIHKPSSWGTLTTLISINTAAHNQSRSCLECTDDNFLLQLMEEPRRGGAMLDRFFPNKEELVGSVKFEGSLDCGDHEMEFQILRAARKVHRKLTILDFRKADFGVFRDLPHRISWDKALEGRGTKESWLVFKDHLLQAQE